LQADAERPAALAALDAAAAETQRERARVVVLEEALREAEARQHEVRALTRVSPFLRHFFFSEATNWSMRSALALSEDPPISAALAALCAHAPH
jgi:hypothetical protein